MSFVFETPEKKSLDDEVRRYRAAKAAATRRERKKMKSGKTRPSKANYRNCNSVDCEQPCSAKAYARDPELQHFERGNRWVCYNAYMRAYRRLCRALDRPYDTRHRNGRLREAQMARRRQQRRRYMAKSEIDRR